jgi:acyl carrier protein
MDSRASIEQRVKKIVLINLLVRAEELTPSTSFVDDLGTDSLGTVDLIMAFEDEFEEEIKRPIPDSDYEKLQTVGQVVDYIAAAAGASQRPLEICE